MNFSRTNLGFLSGAAFALVVLLCSPALACDHDHHNHHHDQHDVLPQQKDSRFLVKSDHVNIFDSPQEQIRASSVCGFHDPTPAEKAEIEKELSEYRARTGGGYAASHARMQKSTTIDIDVYYHNIYRSDSTTGYLTDENIAKQIDVLNRAFGGQTPYYNDCNGGSQPAGVATPFRFNLKEIIRTRNNSYFSQGDEQTISRNLRKGTCADLNIFAHDSPYLGVATYPFGCSADRLAQGGDFCFIDYESVPDGGATNYNEGDTLTHEVGHWLGLAHTFDGGCSESGDEVDDTPAEESPAGGCPVGRDTCPSAGEDPIYNFMDYTNDCCMYTFTAGQSARMVDAAVGSRDLKFNDGPTAAPTKSPVSEPTVTTGSPTSAPTLGDDDIDDDDDDDDTDDYYDGCNDEEYFFWKRGQKRECSPFLQNKPTNVLRMLCKNRWRWGKSGGVVYGPPDKSCPLTCSAVVDSCGSLYENGKARFVTVTKTNKRKLRTCNWLKRKPINWKTKLCQSTTVDPKGVYPIASESCPQSCAGL